jgi:PIN domain nuclease of toxin-antitoxin system
MKYLMDTGVLIHSLISKPKLNQRAISLLEDDSSDLYLSSASSWEIAIKAASGKLSLPASPTDVLTQAMQFLALQALDITHLHALAAGKLPHHHRDPFDRMLIAQARVENMILLTADRAFDKYDVSVFFCGK